ncbi:MAG: sugar phosphate isomerase/epimerase [Deltaproteobacteria bacterium]|nr:sugar phosphate isomerase/epimerase [Deltaproteobacteria bacterium]
MAASALKDFSRLCIHTITTKPWSLETAIEKYAAAGVKGITIWRQWLDGKDPKTAGQMARDAGLEIVSYCRGGFFPAEDAPGRQSAIDDNRQIIDEAEALGTNLIVLVCGAVPGQSLPESRNQIGDGIGAILGHAKSAGIKLGIEPLHPMYADSRSAINTMRQANDFCDQFQDPNLGVAVDVYHLWWDPELKQEILRCGNSGRLLAFHICDWLTPTEDILNDRGLMGDGCINIREIRGWVEDAGFKGFIEVEIFSDRWWLKDQELFLEAIKKAYLNAS